MNFKEALRKDTNYLRGLGSLDAKLRQNWINSNAARLQQARSMLTTEDYKTFAEDLYRLQMWNNLEAENISKGVYGQNFRPTVDYVKNYFNEKVADIDFTLKYHPDLDENNVYVGSKKNTGFSPEMWSIYSNLKDEASKKEFRDKIQTENKVWEDAAQYQANEKSLEKSGMVQLAQSLGDVSGNSTDIWADNMIALTNENHPDNADYLKKNLDKVTPESYNFVNNKNTELAQNIWSRSLKKYRGSDEYKKLLNAEEKSISNRWQNEVAQDSTNAETAHKDEFLAAIKDNPVLAAASGYDPKSNTFSHDEFQQYEDLLAEDPGFKARYIANKNVLAKQVQEGLISEDDYKQSLIDIAKDSLKDHESFGTRATNAIKGAANTGLTYTLHKFAPFVNAAEVLNKQTDGKVFMDAYGNIYKDSDVTSNAQYSDPNDANSAVLYKTSNGTSINYNRDGDKIFTMDGNSYIYQNDDGTFASVDPTTIDPKDTHLRKVSSIDVKNTSIGQHDLVRLGKDDSGNDLNWAGGIFNERYLQLSDRYNISPWQRDELDYYNQFGYSNYVNIQRPGDDSRDFWGETIKMMGFVGADLLMSFATRGIGKIGGAVGMGMKTMRGIELGTGLMGAIGIADSYAQGVFEENLARNEQTLQKIVSDRAKEKAEAWTSTTDGQAAISNAYAEAVRVQEQKLGRPLTDSEKAQIQMATRAQVVNAKAIEQYGLELKSPDVLNAQEKAVSDAGTASIVDFAGEGLKYGIVNTLGFRSWMFKGRGAAEAAARSTEKSLFGKAFSRVAKATQADVDAGLAKNVGDVFLKDAWSNMSKAAKARAVLETTGKQFWGGAWTNWTDEMQSAGAKYQNNSAFDAHLNNNDVSGAYLFANAIASQLQGIKESAMDENSLWAGLIGGAGSVMGFGFNPMGIASLVTKEGREQWNNMSAGEKFNSIFSNSVLSEVYEHRANDVQAKQMLDRANALVKAVDGNTISIMNSLSSASKIGHSENSIEAEENDVINLFHTLQAVDNFSKTNPGLAELDALSSLKGFADEAAKLADVENLSEEDRAGYIEQIKQANPTMTEEQATAELDNVSKRATLMQKMMSDWTDLTKSEEYKKASQEGEEKSEALENMEQKLVLQTLNDYTLQNMRDREERIKGSSTISTIDNIPFTVNGEEIDSGVRAQENDELATYGNKKTALKNIQESHKLVAAEMNERKGNLEKAQASLRFEERVEELKQQIDEAPNSTEKEKLQKQLIDLVRDNAYYTAEIARIDSALEENAYEQYKLEGLFSQESPDSETIISADGILSLDPVARMRMLDKNNFNNYSKKQQTQIKKAIAKLNKNGVDFTDIQNQALASSRYAQREAMLEAIANGETVTPSFNTRVTNMINAANQMIRANVKKYSKDAMKEIDQISQTPEEAKARKLDLLRRYSPATLRFIKDSLKKSDQKLLDEVIPMAETGEQLIDLIYNENYGLTGLSMDERRNLQTTVANTMSISGTSEELIENLAKYATDTINPSINTLLDKLGQVYEQQHSTIVETAKEKAERQAADRRATREREAAAEAALASTEESPAVTAEEAPTTPSSTETPSAPVSTPEVSREAPEEVHKTDEQLIQDAKDAILSTQHKVQPVAERDPHADHYLIDGEKYMRVHGAMGDVWVGTRSATAEANSARSLKNGSLVDGIVRDFFNGVTPVKPEGFTDEAFGALITSLETIKAKLEENGEEFLTNNIVLYHKFPNGVKIAGEADIVSVKIVDGKPQYNIYDLKTSAGGRDGKAFNESPFWETNPNPGTRNTVIGTREQYTNQVSLYKLLFERMLNTPVSQLALLPYKLTYDAENNVTGIEKYPGIALTYNKDVEKLVAYQPIIEDALNRIQHTYKGMFTKEQLATLKGIIANGIIKGEAFGKDVAYFINNQGLEAQFKEVGMGELSPIIKDLKEAVANIDVAETLKEEYKAPEPPPAPVAPVELATVEPVSNEYNPNRESFVEPDVDAEFNTVGEDPNSTQLPQTTQVSEEVTDMTLTTNAEEDINIDEETGEVAATIKGNAMSPWVYEDKTSGIEDTDRQDAQRGILIRKTPGVSMQNYNDWMQARKIDLQGLIDNKLSDILSTGTKDNPVKIFFMRVNPNMTAVGNDRMKSHYLLCVEDTPALRQVYTAEDAAKYGDFVTANGKQYLIVGTAGFANPSQGNAYRKILTTGKNSVQVKSNEYFRANENEEFYVDQDKYTHVARIHSGFITKQLEGDSMPQIRTLSELLNDETRNPLGLTWDSLVFGYQLKNEFRTVPEVDETMYHSPIKAAQNIGNVFLFIKGADGRYTPAMLIPTRYSEINQGTLKQKIDNALRLLTSTNHAERYNGLMALYGLIVLGQKDNNGVVTGTDILIGTDKIPTLTFKLDGKILYTTDLKNVNFQEVLENFARLNPRISVTKTKLLNEDALKELDAAGALRTDIAKLGKSAGDYSVYNIDSDGKPIITDSPITSSNAEIIRGGARKIRVDDQYYQKLGTSYTDEKGNVVTDDSLLESIKLNDFILNTTIEGSTRIGNEEYFVLDMNAPQGVIKRDVGTHRASVVTDANEIATVKNTIAQELAEAAQTSRENAANAALEGVTPIVEQAPTSSTPTSPEVVDTRNSVLDLLNMEEEAKAEEKKQEQPSTPAAPVQDINNNERKSLIGDGNTGKNGNFAPEKSALDIITSDELADAAIDEIMRLWPETEDMTMAEIVDLLGSKGKVTSGIKNVQAWIDTLKC